MTELLERDEDEVTTVSGDDRWASVLGAFADATPVTRPAAHAGSYRAMWSVYRNSSYRNWSAEPVRMSLPRYLVTLDSESHLMSGSQVTLALFGGSGSLVHAEVDDIDYLEAFTHDAAEAVDPVEHPGTVALRELQEWLDLGLDAIVTLVELSPSTRAYWRSNPTAPLRPTKAGKLMRLRVAVGLLVGELGADEARSTLRGEGWLADPLDETKLARLEIRVRQALVPEGLQPPAYLTRGGLSRDELLARALGDDEHDAAEDEQRAAESAATTHRRGDDAPEEA